MRASANDLSARPSTGDLVVTYHYIRPENSDGVTGITPAAFDAQLALLARTHAIVGIDQFGASTTAGSRPRALITFDDGLRDQHRHALPILDRRAVPAVFFAPMRPVDPALDPLDAWTAQHLLHALADVLGWEALESRVMRALGRIEIDEARMDRLYHYETPRKRRLKYALAFAVSPERAAAVLHAINRDGPGAPRLGAGEWFMSREQLADLQSRGHRLGLHGYEHVPYSTLPPLEQAWDFARAHALMGRLFGARARPIAYPFGRHDATTRALADIFGCTRAFTTEDRVDCKYLESTLAAPVERAGVAHPARERAA